MSAPARGADGDDSSRRAAFEDPRRLSGALRGGVLLLGLAGCLLLLLADLSTTVEVRVADQLREEIAGSDQHSWALLLLAGLSLPMTLAAALREIRSAMVAMIALGLVALGIALLVDLPAATDSGLVRGFRDASASPGQGLWFALLGSSALIVGGLGALLATRR